VGRGKGVVRMGGGSNGFWDGRGKLSMEAFCGRHPAEVKFDGGFYCIDVFFSVLISGQQWGFG